MVEDFIQKSNHIEAEISEAIHVESIIALPTVSNSTISVPSNGEIFVFDYMDVDDFAEMKEYIGKHDSLLLLVGSGDIQVHEVESIAKNLKRIGKIASSYHDSYPIGRGLSDLTEVVHAHQDVFLENQHF